MLRALAITIGLLFFAGCDMVTIDKPLGEPFTAKEKASLIGSWVTEGEVSEIQKTKQGDLVVGSLSWDEKEEKFKSESTGITLTTIGQSKYLFAKSDGEYVFCRFVRKDDSNVELTMPDPKAFRKAVEESLAASKDDPSKAIGRVVEKTPKEALAAEKEDPSKAIGRVVEETPNFLVKLSSDSKALRELFESPKIDACFETKAILKYKRIHK